MCFFIFEWSVFDIQTMMTGVISVKAQTCQVIYYTILCTCYTAFYGFQETACALIGNSIGDNDAKLAKRYFKASFIIAAAVGTVVVTALRVFKNQVFGLFETDGLNERLNSNWDLICLSLAMDIINITLGGAIRGIGQQAYASVNYFIAYFIIDLPLSFYLAFYAGKHKEEKNKDSDVVTEVEGMGITGIWTAVCIAGVY